jgi:hypothetical protein
MEPLEESQKLLLVPTQNCFYLRRFLGVRNEHLASKGAKSAGGNTLTKTRQNDLEDMERLELDVLALISQQVHHHLEISFAGDVSRHDIEVCTVEENLAQEFEGLAFRHVVGRENECGE